MPIPPTSIKSWQQIVENNDPDFTRLKMRPWVYEFSNGRRFVLPPNIYTTGYGIRLEGATAPDGPFLVEEGGAAYITTEGGPD